MAGVGGRSKKNIRKHNKQTEEVRSGKPRRTNAGEKKMNRQLDREKRSGITIKHNRHRVIMRNTEGNSNAVGVEVEGSSCQEAVPSGACNHGNDAWPSFGLGEKRWGTEEGRQEGRGQQKVEKEQEIGRIISSRRKDIARKRK